MVLKGFFSRLYNNIESIFNLAQSFNLKPIVGLIPRISGVGLPNYSQERGNEVIAEYNEILLLMCKERGIAYADFRNLGAEYFCDGVHLNHKGDVKMAEIWYETIKGELQWK